MCSKESMLGKTIKATGGGAYKFAELLQQKLGLMCLQKIRAEQAKGWIMVPFWTSQPWMGMLLGMLIDHPRLIRKSKDILIHPSSAESHPLMGHTQLMACLLSGNPFEHEAFIKRVRGSSWHLGSQAQRSSTGHISRGGHSFVVQGISIPLIPLCQTLSTS
ncbi:uncharacterized protein LOC123517178 [Portunus trituberculatus]|uniref:uncharacterized protein LOC123517178 n=1 Tax=Portunus trituberculatus TaxID=210409 RepID=UPI001E1CF105|nr:uncharacterized protein LOC123517178 [Portunus trituberculatus]